MALCFALGSAGFLVGPFPGYAELVGEPATQSPSSSPRAVHHRRGTAEWLAWPARRTPARAAWPGGRPSIQSAGTLFFNVTTFLAMETPLTNPDYNRLVWRPDAFGSVCFLVSGAIAYARAAHGWLPVRGGRGWWQPSSTCSAASSSASRPSPATSCPPPVGPRPGRRELNTSLGAACFLACALDTLHTGEASKIPGMRRLHELERTLEADVRRAV